MKILDILKDVLFKDTFQNYKVISGKNEEFEFTIAYFPVMNPNGIVNLVKFFNSMDMKAISTINQSIYTTAYKYH